MTTTYPQASVVGAIEGPEIRTLRQVMRADVALCAASGTAAIVAARPLADLAGVDGGGAIVAAGAFLLVLAAALAWVAGTTAPRLVRLVPWSAEGDFAWAAGSAVVALAVSMNGTGRALVIAQGVVVLGVGIAKLVAQRAARSTMIGGR